jgi:hypothetical protein
MSSNGSNGHVGELPHCCSTSLAISCTVANCIEGLWGLLGVNTRAGNKGIDPGATLAWEIWNPSLGL